MKNKPLLLIALGGNAMIQKGQDGTAEQQLQNLTKPMSTIAKLSRDYNVVITHGNGPQVGNLLLQQESCDEVPKMPLDVIGSMTEGQIGYMIESTLDTELAKLDIQNRMFLTLITYVILDPDDPLFQNPTKPIGPFYTKEEADNLPYTMTETDKGYRRVVPSPKPVEIVQHKEIQKLIDMDFIVICTGGGGIPVVREGKGFRGVEAVIDKDLASSKLSQEIKADNFVIATDVEGAAINWGKPNQETLGNITLADLKQYNADGQFPAGSMGPKVEALIKFVETTGNTGVICHLDDIEQAVEGKAGTVVTAK